MFEVIQKLLDKLYNAMLVVGTVVALTLIVYRIIHGIV